LKKIACPILSISICLLLIHPVRGQTPESRKVEAQASLSSGVQAYRSGNYQAAADQFSRALQLDPDLTVAELYLGTAYSMLAALQTSTSQEMGQKAIDAFQRALQKDPGMADAVSGLASVYQSSGDLPKAREAYLRLTKMAPQNPAAYYSVGSIDWLMTRDRTNPLPAADRMRVINEGLENVDLALALDPQYQEAMAYKNLLLRSKAEIVGLTDPMESDRLISEANTWFNRALETLKQRSSQTNTGNTTQVPGLSGGIFPPPPPPPGTVPVVGGISGGVPGGVPGGNVGAPPPIPPPPPPPPPFRIGGDIANANLISSVKPTYPPSAREARVQGVVLLQVMIDKTGSVSDVRVISGHPLLNEAAVSAVRQWRYRPSLFNGQPVDVITTVTVNFVFQ
jgi:TonB family protein